MKSLPTVEHPDLLVGKETSDDAGVVRVRDDLALIQTVDFFTPMVNDPRDFGRIAAANALSDVYAMGGVPLTAMNIVCFPQKEMPKEVLQEVLLGGMELIHEAGALLVGGHSIDDREIKYGLSVTGTVHPDKVMTNAGARSGDRLILTKPVGAGILATAHKGRILPDDVLAETVRWMTKLNRDAAEAMQEIGCHACTDVTGFGLLGHALEMSIASKVEIVLYASKVPVMSKTLEMAEMGMVPEGTFMNRQFCQKLVSVADGIDIVMLDILSDVQTSGGLLIAVPEEKAESLHRTLETRGEVHAEIGIVNGTAKGNIRVLP